MSVIKEILKQMDNNVGDSIYLREIALLMEENDLLGETIDKLKNELKSCKLKYIKLQDTSSEAVVMINKLKKELKQLRK